MDKRSRNWLFIVYPQDLDDGWQSRLEEDGFVGFISPLHDKDVYESGEHKGELKKPHYHVMLQFKNARYYSAVLAAVQNSIGKDSTGHQAVSVLKTPVSVSASYAYLSHENSPDKAHYNKDDIVPLNGATPPKTDESRSQASFSMGVKIMQIATDEGINNVGGLVCWCIANGDCELYSYIEHNTFFVRELLRNIIPFVPVEKAQPLDRESQLSIEQTQLKEIDCVVPF